MVKLKEDLVELEGRILNELRHLKNLILNGFRGSSQLNSVDRNYYRDIPQPPVNDFYEYSAPSNSHVTKNPVIFTTTPTTTTTTLKIESATRIVPQVQLKSLETPRNRVKTPTIPPKNEYYFYWKLVNFPKVFMHAKKSEIFSDSFKIKGLTLRIRAHLNFEEKEELTLDIEQLAEFEHSDKMEISIGDGLDGLVFKEIADEKLFQFSFEIIDQVNHPNHGFISPVYWNTEDGGFLIQNCVQMLSNYLKNDSLLIKVTINF